jgi:Kef-type K+ transport system membrane component KefB
VEIDRLLLELFLIFAAAKLAGELFERIRQPPVIGELIVGVILGPHALGAIGESEVHEIFQQLGAIVLLFMVGLDTRLGELRAVGRRALGVGTLGIAMPFLTGLAFVTAIEGSLDEGMFVGAAMVATSVGITARVLADLGVIHEVESRIVLGAAVVDDVWGLLVLAAVSGGTRGDLTALDFAALAIGGIGFVLIVATLGRKVVSAAIPAVTDAKTQASPVAFALAVCLGLSALAGQIGLAAIIGAFLAGMAFSESRPEWDLENQLESVYVLLVPYFFVITGSAVDPSIFTSGSTVLLVAAITGLALVGKLIGCGLGMWGTSKRSVAIVGVGMVPRGEVGIIVASVGLSRDIIDNELYGAIVAMSILTTLIAPPILKALYAGRPTQPRAPGARRGRDVEGIGG